METEAEPTDSELALQLSPVPATDLHKAWHIFALLLSHGRPARPIDVASMCTLFPATSSLVESLCRIPKSPIYLTPECLVTLSSNGHIPAREIAENSNAILKIFPNKGFEILSTQRIDEDAVKTYFRKRKLRPLDEYFPLVGTELTNLELGLQCNTDTITDLDKAWHVFALLLLFGRPAQSTELASRCTLFHANSNLVEYLCGIPNSPICLTSGNFVTLSRNGCIPAREIAENSAAKLKFLQTYEFENVLGQRIDEEAVKTYFRKKRKMGSEDDYFPVAEKRGVLHNFEEGDGHAPLLALPCSVGDPSGKVYLPNGNMSSGIELPRDSEILAVDVWQNEKAMLGTSLFNNSAHGHFSSGLRNRESGNKETIATLVNANEVGHPYGIEYHFNFVDDDKYQYFSMVGTKVNEAIPSREINFNIVQTPDISTTAKIDVNSTNRNSTCFATSVREVDQQMNASQTEAQTAAHAYGSKFEDFEDTEREEGPFFNSCCCRKGTENQPIDTAEKDELLNGKPVKCSVEACNTGVSFIEKEKSRTPLKSQAILMENSVSPCNKPTKSSQKSKPGQKNAQNQCLQSTGKALKNCSIDDPLQVPKRDKKSNLASQDMQYDYDQVMNAKEKKEHCTINGESSSIVAFDKLDQRVLPDFEAFVAEEQEGSGGYGTVYKARRKSDGRTFAIKYGGVDGFKLLYPKGQLGWSVSITSSSGPHANANRNHVQNELKMLERFGGKNFVIKHEGSFKSGNTDCLVLEHVEHDRPEVLKRNIDVQELQWYGYCMFRALAGLHKQGVVHRDVKPGNFLFNRKACKGYLIDFNLALNLNQKHSTTMDKAKALQDVCLIREPLPNGKSLPSAKHKKFVTSKALEVANQEQGKVLKSLFPSKNKKTETEKLKTHNEVGSRNITKSQGADGSGITSAKDATSTRTQSGEKFREPLPCHGRKELISLVHEALQSPNHKAASIPVSKRKRIAAPQQTDCKFIYLTPMPLHLAGVAIGSAGLLKTKGDGKHNREGPCVGTKGFRAPEVLVRSQHQGPKVDIWSAGVTLLYLMIGRTPFAGDPDQNMKEIARLRGSEDLWEVAKLHNRESSFPMDLLDIKSLRSLKLQDWCKQNTRRPEFFNGIPGSLFDLVDKCLTVNPRLRISAEEALRHEFFSPCHEALRKHRLLRQQEASLDSGSDLISHVQSQTCEEVS